MRYERRFVRLEFGKVQGNKWSPRAWIYRRILTFLACVLSRHRYSISIAYILQRESICYPHKWKRTITINIVVQHQYNTACVILDKEFLYLWREGYNVPGYEESPAVHPLSLRLQLSLRKIRIISENWVCFSKMGENVVVQEEEVRLVLFTPIGIGRWTAHKFGRALISI